MSRCKRLALTIARGWRRIALNESGGVSALAHFGCNRYLSEEPEKGNRVSGDHVEYRFRIFSLSFPLIGYIARSLYRYIAI